MKKLYTTLTQFLMEKGFSYEHVYGRIYQVRGLTVLENYATYPENMGDAKEFVEKYKEQVINK